MDSAQILKYAGWFVLACMSFTLVFTKAIIDWLGMENSMISVVILITPLVVLYVGIEMMTRRTIK